MKGFEVWFRPILRPNLDSLDGVLGHVVEPVLFFGAGASAPFGIPTMQRMVVEFEDELKKDGDTHQQELYARIKTFLSVNLGRPVDLEAVFTIVDSIIDWSPDRLGISALYHTTRLTGDLTRAGNLPTRDPLAMEAPSSEETSLARNLRSSLDRKSVV